MRIRTGVLLLMAFMLTMGGRELRAQTARDTLIMGLAAARNFDSQGALRLLSLGMSAFTPHDSVSTVAIHRLVQLLVDNGNVYVSELWARWAVRSDPALANDRNYPTRVINVLDAAREYVAQDTTDQSVVRIMFQWSDAAADPSSEGAIQLMPSNMLSPLRMVVRGLGALGPGEQLELPPGSYVLEGSAGGYRTAEVTREVLPGVTTALRFKLRSEAPGNLFVASTPWAEVLIDGVSVGYTLLSAYPIEPGFRDVRVRREGYVPFDTTLNVTRGQTIRLGPIRLRERRPQ